MVVFLDNFGIIRTVATKIVKQTCTITYIRAALSFHELIGLFVDKLISEWTGIIEYNSTTDNLHSVYFILSSLNTI